MLVPSDETTPTTDTPTAGTDLIVPDIIPAPLACGDAYTVKVWQHLDADAMAMEFKSKAVVIFRWTWIDNNYVKEQEAINSATFSRADYTFKGWTIARKLNVRKIFLVKHPTFISGVKSH